MDSRDSIKNDTVYAKNKNYLDHFGHEIMVVTIEKPQILVLDDEKFIAKLLRIITEKEGFITEYFTEPQRALERFERIQHDIILLDLHLPGTNGLELIKRFKSMGDAKIIIVSGVNDHGIERKCMEEGASDFLNKPFRSNELIGMIKKHL